MFSIWTIGPIYTKSEFYSDTKGSICHARPLGHAPTTRILGVSFLHTWLNLLLSLSFSIGGWIFIYKKFHFILDKSAYCIHGFEFVFFKLLLEVLIPVFLIAAIPLLFFQFNETFNKFCCFSLQKIIKKYTVLDVGNIDKLIELEILEQDQENNNINKMP